MSDDPKIAVVQRVYEAFERGDVATILDQLTDDVDWASESEQIVAPWHGRRIGKPNVPGFFQALGETIEVTEFTPLSFATNETDVMVVIRFGMTVRATGRSGVMDLHHWWRFRGDKIYFYRGTEDTVKTAALVAA